MIGLDIDHFKKVNDTYGHEGGDEVLRCFARIVTSLLRKEDSLYRCGGEEFAAMLPLTDPVGTLTSARRIVEAAASSPVKVGAKLVPITTSAGAACLEAGDDGAKLLSRADATLYEAKKTGRNRACLSGGSAR